MKKYITLAALLAAGTAFANAVEPAKSFSSAGDGTWDISDLTFTNNGITVAVSLDVETLKGYFQGSEGGHLLVDVIGNNDIGFGALVKNNTEYFSGAWNQTVDYTMTGSSLDMGNESIWTNATTASVVFSADRTTGARIYFALGDGTRVLFETTGTASSVKASGWTIGDEITVDTSAVLSGDVYTSYISADDAKSIATAMVPEPSAFGMLAGLGALALVASRRRRRK